MQQSSDIFLKPGYQIKLWTCTNQDDDYYDEEDFLGLTEEEEEYGIWDDENWV